MTWHQQWPDAPFGISTLDVWCSKLPPAILFDTVYADAILYHFGTQALKDEVTETWKDTFYSSGVMNMASADYNLFTDEWATRAQNWVQEHKAHYEASCGPNKLDILMILPYILVPPNKLKMMLREIKEKVAVVVEQRCIQEKVGWSKSLLYSLPIIFLAWQKQEFSICFLTLDN